MNERKVRVILRVIRRLSDIKRSEEAFEIFKKMFVVQRKGLRTVVLINFIRMLWRIKKVRGCSDPRQCFRKRKVRENKVGETVK